jgi:hypothetical protein
MVTEVAAGVTGTRSGEYVPMVWTTEAAVRRSWNWDTGLVPCERPVILLAFMVRPPVRV